jgi:putative tryptophan/tyrosine transport system substrate-binding protein
MAIKITKRKFIATLGGGAVWSLVARAQPTNRIRLIGVLMGFAESDPTTRSMVEAFRGALPKLGWTEGNNVRIEVRWGGYGADRIKMLAKELVDLRPDAILGQTTPVIGALAQCDAVNSNRVRDRNRSDQQRLRREPCPSGRQHHGLHC